MKDVLHRCLSEEGEGDAERDVGPLMWVLWRERNKRAFEGEVNKFVLLKIIFNFLSIHKVPVSIDDSVSFIEPLVGSSPGCTRAQ